MYICGGDNMTIRLSNSNILLFYQEFGTLNAPSLKDFFEKSSYEGQNKIIEYLESGRIKLAASSLCKDAFTGEIIAETKTIMTDGEYSWNNMLSYYVKKYNLRLPGDFERKVLKREEVIKE